MAQVSIGELVVTIRGDTAQMEAAAKRVVDALGKVKQGVKDAGDATANQLGSMVGRWIGLGLVVQGVRSAIAAFQNIMSDISAMDRLSASSGTTIERLSSLRSVAAQNGVTFEELTQVVGQFANRLREFASNPVSAGAQAFRLMGIAMRDAQGNLRTLEQMLPEIADRFASMPDGINKTAIAIALFGERAGPGMVRFLNQGSAAIAFQRNELEQTNRVLSAESTAQAREYERQMAILATTISDVATKLAIQFVPALNTVTETLTQFFHLMRGTVDSTRSVGELGVELAQLFRQQNALRERLATEEGWGWLGITHVQATRAQLEALEARIKSITERMIQLQGLPGQVPSLAQVGKPGDGGVADLAARQRDIQLTTERLAMMQNQLSGMPILYQQAFGNTGAWSQPFLAAMAQIQHAQDIGAISAQRAGQMRIQLQRQEQDEMLNTASLAASTLTTVFNKSKAASIAAAIINTAVGVTKALSGSVPPFNFINAALVAAAGAAQLAAIQSTSQSGGGTVAPVGGGGSAEDGSGGGAASQTLFIRGLNANEFLTGDAVRDIAERMIEFQRNGGKVVLDRPRA